MNAKELVQEHFELIELIQRKYKEGDYRSCEKYCIEDIQKFPLYIDALSYNLNFDPIDSCSEALTEHRAGAQDMKLKNEQEQISDKIPIRIVSFETLAKVYEKQQRYDDGIKVCEQAIKYNLQDGTKGGFKGRLKKFEKLKNNPPSSKLSLEAADTVTNIALVDKINSITKIDFPELDWYISVSFSKSSSSNFSKALFLMQNTAYLFYETEIEGQTIYQAIFLKEREQYLNFVQLYELVSNWKSTFVLINGKLTDRKIISGLNYCYGDKCRSGRSDFCFGASEMTDNPFGCHRLQVSKFNNPWWSFSKQQGNRVVIDKQAMKQRINEYSRAYMDCPDFNYDNVIQRLNNLPDSLALKQYLELKERTLSIAEVTIDGEGNPAKLQISKQAYKSFSNTNPQAKKEYSATMYKVSYVLGFIFTAITLVLAIAAPFFLIFTIIFLVVAVSHRKKYKQMIQDDFKS